MYGWGYWDGLGGPADAAGLPTAWYVASATATTSGQAAEPIKTHPMKSAYAKAASG